GAYAHASSAVKKPREPLIPEHFPHWRDTARTHSELPDSALYTRQPGLYCGFIANAHQLPATLPATARTPGARVQSCIDAAGRAQGAAEPAGARTFHSPCDGRDRNRDAGDRRPPCVGPAPPWPEWRQR